MSLLEHQATDLEVFQRNIIAIPGTQNTPFHWETFRDESAKMGVGVHTIVSPGRGSGPKFGRDYDPGFYEFGDTIWRSIEEKLSKCERKPILAGHSLGGLFALHFLADPKKAKLFEAGLLLAPATPPDLPGPSKEFSKANLWPTLKMIFGYKFLKQHDPVEMDLEIARRFLFGLNSEIPEEQIRKLLEARVPEARQLMIDLVAARKKFLRFLIRKEIEAIDLSRIKIPVHIFSGTEDAVTPPEGATALKAAIGENATLELLPNERHGLIESRSAIQKIMAELRSGN